MFIDLNFNFNGASMNYHSCQGSEHHFITKSVWKRCLHISDNHKCKPDVTMFDELCQTCGKKAVYAMVFNWSDIVLYACEECAGVKQNKEKEE